MAGWAANDGDITVAPTAIGDLVYDGNVAGQTLVNDGTVEGAAEGWDIYYAVVAKDGQKPAWGTGDGAAFSTALPKKVNAGSYDVYYVAWKTTAAAPTVDAKVTVTIAKKAASATVNAIADLKWTNKNQALVLVTENSEEGGVVNFSSDQTAWSTAVPVGNAVNTYPVYYKVVANDDNYKDSQVFGPINVEIGKRVFSAANLNIVITNDKKYYNGQLQPVNVSITDKSDDITTALASTDFTVAYLNEVPDPDETEPLNAGVYAITITGTGTGNYGNQSITGAALGDVQTLTIKKYQAYVKVKDASKVYNGAAYTPGNDPNDDPVFEFEFSGFRNGEQCTDNGAAKYVEITDAGAKVTGYEDDVTTTAVNEAKINQGTYKVLDIEDVTKFTARNYSFAVAELGTLTISKRKLVISLPNHDGTTGKEFVDGKTQKTYGVADPNFNTETWKAANVTFGNGGNANGGSINAEAAAVRAELDIARTNATEQNVGKYTGVITATVRTAHPKLDNYDYNTTITPANFNIVKANLTVAIGDQELTYTGVAKTTADLDVLTPADLTVVGLKNGDTAASLFTNNMPEYSLSADAKNVGYYNLDLTGAPLANYNVEYIPGELHIKPAALTVNISPQTMTRGAVIADVLNKELFKVTGMQNHEDYKALFEVALANEAIDGTNNTLVNTEVNYTGGDHLKLVLKTGAGIADAAANYTGWATATGKLVIAGAGTYVLDDNATITIAAGDIDGNPTNVTLSSSRSLNPQQWYSMVLPFDVTVAKLSQAFGYAIVNRLNTTSTTADHVAFSLEMQKISANEPFLIKIVGVESGNTYVAKDLNNVTIPDVVLVAPEEVAVGSATTNQFIGNYTYDKELSGDDIGFLSKGEWVCPFSNVKKFAPLNAYLKYSIPRTPANQAPLITVEDENGTTAIMSVAADGRFVEADGWYTLNGVKLQGVPTEKGIYIRNGKKIVVK